MWCFHYSPRIESTQWYSRPLWSAGRAHETRTGHGPCVGPKPGNTNGENRKPKTARSIAPSSLGSEVVEGGGASKAMLLSFVNYLVFAGSRLETILDTTRALLMVYLVPSILALITLPLLTPTHMPTRPLRTRRCYCRRGEASGPLWGCPRRRRRCWRGSGPRRWASRCAG